MAKVLKPIMLDDTGKLIAKSIDGLTSIQGQLPTGGTTGDVLVKNSDVDRDTTWTKLSKSYDDLLNKPTIEGNVLEGELSLANIKAQQILVSGENIVTINNKSLLSSGNINIPVVEVDDKLTSTSSTHALSALQGKTLNDKVTTLTEQVGTKSYVTSVTVTTADLTIAADTTTDFSASFTLPTLGVFTMASHVNVSGNKLLVPSVTVSGNSCTFRVTNLDSVSKTFNLTVTLLFVI